MESRGMEMIKKYSTQDCIRIMKQYEIEKINDIKMIDSSRGEEDIRHNYIIDKKYVLRMNSAKIFSEERLRNLNCLIKRYNDFGIKAPLFLNDKSGKILHEDNDVFYYVSEYLDGLVPPDELTKEQTRILINERLKLIASFAEKYRDEGFFSFMSMYSLFDLSPYDEPLGIDEKQDNLNQLVQTLRDCNEADMAEKLETLNCEIRDELLRIYKDLPRCVFQGDENWGNLIVDENYHICGLFDFNMAGTDVIVNYFANNALLEPGFLEEEYFAKFSAEWIYKKTMEAFKENTKILESNYNFSELERVAYKLYAKLVLISSYPNLKAFQYFFKNEKYNQKAREVLLYFMDGR